MEVVLHSEMLNSEDIFAGAAEVRCDEKIL
jgi:hypothetical protein